MGQLVTYDIDKKSKGKFKLSFTTIANTEVDYSYDAATNINTVTLTTGTNNKTKFSQEFNSVNGKLHLSFQQINNNSRATTPPPPPPGEPVIIIDDDL